MLEFKFVLNDTNFILYHFDVRVILVFAYGFSNNALILNV